MIANREVLTIRFETLIISKSRDRAINKRTIIISTTEPSEPAIKSKGNRRRRWWIALSLIVALVLLIRPALWGIGLFLVYNEVPIDAGSHLLLLDAAEVDLVAAEAWQKHPDQRILILQKLPGRPMELGVLPPFDVFIRARLEKRGIPRDSTEVIPGNALDQASHVKQLQGWLKAHPDAEVVGICDQLSGRTWRSLLDHILSTDEAKRVHLHAVVRPNVNASNWWKSKVGIIFTLQQYLTFLYSDKGAEK